MRRGQPNGALAELLAQSGELDRILDGRGLLFDNEPNPVVPAPPGLYIPPPDWDAEARERAERERQERDAELAEAVEEKLAAAEIEPAEAEEPRLRGQKGRKALRRGIRQAWTP